MIFKEVDVKALNINPFSIIEDDWFLITSVKDGKVNTMTAASGALGHMFRKNVAYINIRPSRYTKEFIDSSNYLSLSFFDNTEDNKKILKYLGTVSGRNEDKINKCGFTLSYEDNIPYFTNAHTVFLCKPIYIQAYNYDSFVDKAIDNYYYPNKDYHDLYICDIFKALIKSNE